jgi:hypothetical protein
MSECDKLFKNFLDLNVIVLGGRTYNLSTLGWNVTVLNVTADVLLGGRIAWVEMSRDWFLAGQIVKAPYLE